jgi:hypothetical protein
MIMIKNETIKNMLWFSGNILITLIIVGLVSTTTGDTGATGPAGSSGLPGISGVDGLPGSNGADGESGLTPYVGENGNWWIGDEDTFVSATGNNGLPMNDGIIGGLMFDDYQDITNVYTSLYPTFDTWVGGQSTYVSNRIIDGYTLIETPEQLLAIAQNTVALSKNYVLGNDLDLSSYTTNPGFPLGNVLDPFEGIFDGAGYVIRGLDIMTGQNSFSIFGTTVEATILNITFEDNRLYFYNPDTFESYSYGSLVSDQAFGSTFANLVFFNNLISGAMYGSSYMGIVSGISEGSTYTNIYFDQNEIEDTQTNNGFVAGYANFSIFDRIYVNEGSFNSNLSNIGFVAGYSFYSYFINIDVHSSIIQGFISGYAYSGAVVGYLARGIIYNVNISTTLIEGNDHIGGIAGEVEASLIINAQLDYMTLLGPENGSMNIGGMVGHLIGSTVLNSFMLNSLIQGDVFVGGLAGNVETSFFYQTVVFNSMIKGNTAVGGFFGAIFASIDLYYSASFYNRVDGIEYVGGLAGLTYLYRSTSTIESLMVIVDIQSAGYLTELINGTEFEAQGVRMGGMIGLLQLEDANIHIRRSGIASQLRGFLYLGGFFGEVDMINGLLTIEESFAFSYLQVTLYAGGFVGIMSGGHIQIKNSYFYVEYDVLEMEENEANFITNYIGGIGGQFVEGSISFRNTFYYQSGTVFSPMFSWGEYGPQGAIGLSKSEYFQEGPMFVFNNVWDMENNWSFESFELFPVLAFITLNADSDEEPA